VADLLPALPSYMLSLHARVACGSLQPVSAASQLYALNAWLPKQQQQLGASSNSMQQVLQQIQAEARAFARRARLQPPAAAPRR
jgi:hypothetical protein